MSIKSILHGLSTDEFRLKGGSLATDAAVKAFAAGVDCRDTTKLGSGAIRVPQSKTSRYPVSILEMAARPGAIPEPGAEPQE